MIQILCHSVTGSIPQHPRDRTEIVGPDLRLLGLLEETQETERERDPRDECLAKL